MNQAATFKPGRWLSDNRIFLILAIMAVAAVAVALWASASTNPLRGDSAEYLYFDRSRSVGYPAFLALIRLLTGRVALAVPIQMLLLGASLLALGLSFYRMTGRGAGSIIFMAALVGQAGMWFSSAFLMTEAISTALVALWCAQLHRTRTPSPRNIAAMVAICALATMVRPPLIVMFGASAVFFLGVVPKAERWRAMLMTAVGLIAAVTATPAAQFLVHGSPETTSPFARGVLQHTLYCDVGAPLSDPDAALVEQAAAPVRRYIEAAPPQFREQLRREYSTPLRFGLIIPTLGRRHQVDRRSSVDPYLAPIARQRVVADPLCYSGSVFGEYARMAVFDTDPTYEDGQGLRAFFRDNPPVELPQVPVLSGDESMALRAAAEVGSKPAGLNPSHYRLNVVAKVPFLALLPFRLAFGGAALIGALAILALPFRRRAELLPIATMGIAFHGALLITAVVEIGFFRYLVPLWPIVCTLLAMSLIAFAAPGHPAGASHDS